LHYPIGTFSPSARKSEFSKLPNNQAAAASFAALPRGYFGAMLADPPWKFYNWSRRPWWERADRNTSRAVERHYDTLSLEQLCALPVGDLAADDCALFLWACWPNLRDALAVIEAWGFIYKTCAFCWTKAHAGQIEMFRDDFDDQMGLGYWTRANSEPCLLATRGDPKRLNADVRQAIIEPRREHSRKPDCVRPRIERLVAGPYLELFARRCRPGWTVWGDEILDEGTARA
jgi:N6-adenosine-specific RNA methylase IME4